MISWKMISWKNPEDWLMALIALNVFVLGFVYLPASLSADAECLEAGYPRSTVTWNLKKYCMNHAGTVVKELSDAVKN